MVGARLPGVMLDAVASSERGMLYWQRTYFWAAVHVSRHYLEMRKGYN